MTRQRCTGFPLFLIAMLTLAALPGAHAADPEAPMLTPGPGWTGPTPQPDPIGTGFGADAKAIARWDVVPYQTIDCCFEVGVVAFHINGIDRVEFSADNGPWVAVREMTLNPRTQVVEYWAVVDGNAFPDGPIEIRAIAYPKVGIPRVLAGESTTEQARIGQHSLFLFGNSGGSLPRLDLFVSHSGSDSNPGTAEKPKATIMSALNASSDGGQVILMDPGVYSVAGTIPTAAAARKNVRWITIKPAPNLTQDQVTISQPTRMSLRTYVNRLQWQRVTFDFSTISQYYNEPGRPVWFDQVKWIDPNGWDYPYSSYVSPIRADLTAGSFVTDSTAEQMRYGFTYSALVRNSKMDHISGDALQNSRLVLNCSVTTMRTVVSGLHKDVLQMWGGHQNTIAYGLTATDLHSTQGLFLQSGTGWDGGDTPRFLDCAFVNITFRQIDPESANASQCEGPFSNVYFRNVDFGVQKMLLRTDFTEADAVNYKYPFSAVNVVFEGCTFVKPLPRVDGVIVIP